MKKRWMVVIGVLLSVALVFVIALKLEWRVLSREIADVDMTWLLVTIICNAGGLAVRAYRWRWIAGGDEYRFFHFWKATSIGALANQIFPARAGEVVKIAVIHRIASLPLGTAAFSAIYDRLSDVVVLVVAGFLVVMLQSNSILGHATIAGVLAVVLGLTIAGVLFGKFGHRLSNWAKLFSRWIPLHLAHRVKLLYWETLHTARALFQARRLLGLVGIMGVVFLFDYVAIFGTLRAFSWHLPAISPVTVWVFLALATALPSAPGYVGIYQAACILALSLFGIDESRAVAFALVFQGATIGTAAALTAAFYLWQWRPSSGLLRRNKPVE